MANPQRENGHVRIANEVFDALIAIRISGEARQVLDFIIRKTWGWGKKSDFIPLSQFTKATGLKKSSVIKARIKLIKMNLITVTQKVNADIPIYCFVKDYSKWKPLPKKETHNQKSKHHDPKSKLVEPKKLPSINTYSKDTISKDNKTLISSKEVEAFFRLWNKYAVNGVKRANKLTKTREKQIKLRLKEEPILDYWQSIFSKLQKLPFYCGENKNGWQVNIDYIIRNDTNHVKIYEINENFRPGEDDLDRIYREMHKDD